MHPRIKLMYDLVKVQPTGKDGANDTLRVAKRRAGKVRSLTRDVL